MLSLTIKRAKQQEPAPLPHPSLTVQPRENDSSTSLPSTFYIYAAILILCTIAIYLPVHSHPFSINDDEQYVVNNPHLRGGLSWQTVQWAFRTSDLANWHPLTWLSHALDVQLFQLNPAGHHDINLLLHAINALLLFLVLQRATGYTGRSFMVAALFALHPINVETVAWIAERKSLLSMFFFLLALGAYRAYAAKPGVLRYLTVALLYALGLMAKPQIITFPLVLLLWDYWPLCRTPVSDPDKTCVGIQSQSITRLVLEKVPLLVLSLGSAVMTMRAQRMAGALRFYPLAYRIENAIVSYVRYIGKAFWPSPLIPFYPHSDMRPPEVVWSLVLLLLVSAFALYQRQRRFLAVGWFWYLGTLVPMIGIVQVGDQAMADRYAYLSFVGLFLMLCWGISDWITERRLRIVWLMLPSVLTLVALLACTHRQLEYWSSNVKLWQHALDNTNGSFVAEENLGEALLEAGRPDNAMPYFERVIADQPSSKRAGREQIGYAAVAHLYLGVYDQQHGFPQPAIEHYEAVLTLAQRFRASNVSANVPPVLLQMEATALGNMGYVYFGLGRLSEARTSFENALRLDRHGARDWVGLGLVEQKSKDLPGAIKAYSQAAQFDRSDVNFLLLAQALEKSGQASEARAARQQAILASADLDAAQVTVNRMLAH